MTRFMIWGYSDDTVVISQNIEQPDIMKSVAELCHYDTTEEAAIELHFSDETIIKLWYDLDYAVWRAELIEQSSMIIPGAGAVIVPAESPQGIYSDIVFLTGTDLQFLKATCEGEEIDAL